MARESPHALEEAALPHGLDDDGRARRVELGAEAYRAPHVELLGLPVAPLAAALRAIRALELGQGEPALVLHEGGRELELPDLAQLLPGGVGRDGVDVRLQARQHRFVNLRVEHHQGALLAVGLDHLGQALAHLGHEVLLALALLERALGRGGEHSADLDGQRDALVLERNPRGLVGEGADLHGKEGGLRMLALAPLGEEAADVVAEGHRVDRDGAEETLEAGVDCLHLSVSLKTPRSRSPSRDPPSTAARGA